MGGEFMRGFGWFMIALMLALLHVRSSHAGVYNPAESEEVATYPDFTESPTGRNFRDVLLVLRSIPVALPAVDNPIRRRYVFEEQLITRSLSNIKTLEDRIHASAVLIRRRKFKEAEEVLRPVATQVTELDNIPIQSNFATALHLSGELQKARETMADLVRDPRWKVPWDELPQARQQLYKNLGWSDVLYNLNREYDAYYLKLLQLRFREHLAKKTGKGIVEPPDALFDDGKDPPTPVKFLDENDRFEAGRIANAEKAKLDRLPKEQHPSALAIVQQLCVWLPDDLRLYWLLGEVYNAQGGRDGVLAAYRIFSDLSKFEPVSDDVKGRIGTRLNVLTLRKDQYDQEDQRGIGLDPVGKKDNEGSPVDWRTAGVSFAAGFVFALAAVWQVREIQRRRQARQAPRKAHSV
jgi:hypothetical protein